MSSLLPFSLLVVPALVLVTFDNAKYISFDKDVLSQHDSSARYTRNVNDSLCKSFLPRDSIIKHADNFVRLFVCHNRVL